MKNVSHFRTLAARLFAAGLLLTTASSALADLRYVNVNSTNSTPPYTSWATAATNIQAAVDAAVAGDEIVVTNGIYTTGGRAVYGTMTNRVAVDKPLTLRSINGPQFTSIHGAKGNWDGIRCVYLTNGATLSGFTLTNGAADGDGGGLWCESTNAVVSNCVVIGNSAYAYGGGGAYCGTLNNCTLTANFARAYGGGAFHTVLNNCTLTSNSGGAFYCTLNNCKLTENSGWVALDSSLNNCTLSGNSGGVASSMLNNCTITGNSGGVGNCAVNNCIVYFNEGANYYSSTLNYSCTTPQPTNGVGNISLDPQLASASHLSAGSPCRGTGNAAYATGADIDGEAWARPPSMGCDEYYAGEVTGPLTVGIIAAFTNVLTVFTVQFTALIEGQAAACSWDFGDGIGVTNQPYTSHAWAALGDYAVVLRAYNESQPGGISATVTVHVVVPPVHYVASANTNPVAPYMSWATAATNIQDAVDAVTVPEGALVLVNNGIYATGGRPYARVTVDKTLTLRSLNGPQFTTIDGGNAVRCVYLNRAILSGFTLTNGFIVDDYGAGVSGGVVTNCVLAGNHAAGDTYGSYGGGAASCMLNNCILIDNRADSGGGAYGGMLNNCTLARNSAVSGGGACQGVLNNCTLTRNHASRGGGAYGGTLNNCMLSGNLADLGGADQGGGAFFCTLNNCTLSSNFGFGGGGTAACTLNNCIAYFNSGENYDSCTLNYSCTTPQPTNGVGNITNAPLFVDTNGWSNLRLQSNSPCINAGLNAFAPAGPDLDGNPRIVGGTVDIGAYEFQSPASIISYAWLLQYGLLIASSTDNADPDGDGVDNYHEWLAGTDPTNRFSSPAQLTIIPSGVPPSGIILTWSTNAVGFTLQSATNLSSPTVWSTNSPAPVVIAGQNTITNPITGAQQFYRLVQ